LCSDPEQLADGARPPERIAQRLDVERCRGHELAVHLREQERPTASVRLSSAASRSSAGSVAVSDVPDHKRLEELDGRYRRVPTRQPAQPK
jgi:hypothetical protein